MSEPFYALSVKQPWAALLATGRKTIEVRTWPTSRRGCILIHAGKLIDNRPEAWAWIDTPELQAAANHTGGVVGVAELIDCVTYTDTTAFAADRCRHLNDPRWFRPPHVYGFSLASARLVPFTPYKGRTMFFPVAGVDVASCCQTRDGTRRMNSPRRTGLTITPL